MSAITPQCLEEVAQSYARLIKANVKTLADVPQDVESVYNRVVELIAE